MIDEDKKKKISDALYKRALGYIAQETNEEYAIIDGEMKLVKQKISQKEVPPEMSAIKMLLGDDNEPQMSEEELIRERDRLLELLRQKSENKEK